jgi:hypothetical protein
MLVGTQPHLIAAKILLPRSVPGLIQRSLVAKQLTINKAGPEF